MTFTLRFALMLALLLLFVAPAPAQDKPADGSTKERPPEGAANKIDAKDLVERMTKQYGAYLDFSCTIKQTISSGQMKLETTTQFQWKAKGKIRTDTTRKTPLGVLKMQTYNNSKKAVTFSNIPFPVYAELEPDDPMASGNDPYLPRFLQGDLKLPKNRGIKIGAEQVTVEGVVYQRLNISNPSGAVVRLDFRKDDGMLVRASQVIRPPAGEADPKGRLGAFAGGISNATTYEDIKVDQGLEDEIFDFIPPDGARKVDKRAFGSPSGAPRPTPGRGLIDGAKKKPGKKPEPKKND